MAFTEQDIVVLMEHIWLSTLRLPTRPSDAGSDLELSGVTLDGLINITGDWQGTVALQVPKQLAARIAGQMFDLGKRAPTLEDMQDALGEITNMTGGSIKALLPGKCHLSLPAVVQGANYTIRVPSSQMVTRIIMECEGMPAVVSLMSAVPLAA